MSSDYDWSDESDYRRKRRKKKSHRKKDPIKLCARLTAKLLMTAYTSKIIKFKLDEDPLQSRILFITFVESLEMIFSKYEETCGLLLDYLQIVGKNIKYFKQKLIGNLLYANIDVHSRILIAEFPGDVVKCIAKLQSRCANMIFADKSRYDNIFQQITY